MMPGRREMLIKELERVTGGNSGTYSDAEYCAAGIQVIGPGIFYDHGYIFRGKMITTLEAKAIAWYYHSCGVIAPDSKVALEAFNKFKLPPSYIEKR